MSVSKPSAGGPQPLSATAEARREEILDAALDLFSRHGFHDTSIAHIAAGANVSRAAVYQYFQDKRDILSALAQRVKQQMVATFDAWAPLPAAPANAWENPAALHAQLRGMIETRLSQFLVAATAQNVAATRLVLRSLRGHDDPIRDATRRIEAHVVGIITQDVRTAIRLGWARECDAETIALFVLGGIEKLLFRALDADEPATLNHPELIKEIGAFIFAGLAATALGPPDVPRLSLLPRTSTKPTP